MRVQEMKLKNFADPRWAYRAWYYFRMGYSTYLTFLLGYMSTLTTVYYLAIKNAPVLIDIFPRFLPFAILCSILGAPLAVGIGWIHLKRSGVFTSELDIGLEANPYAYKLTPGKETEVGVPLALLQLRLIRRLVEANRLMTDTEKLEIDRLEKRMLTLLQGGYVGSPRRRTPAS